MSGGMRFPIRVKIMLSLLFVVTSVVSIITFTMANLFHQDKTTYINNMISIVGESTAEECRSLLIGYEERLEVYSRIMRHSAMDGDEKTALLSGLFDDFPELVAVELYEDGEVAATAYDAKTLEIAALKPEDIVEYRKAHPLPIESIVAGETYVRNSTLDESLPFMTMAVAPGDADGNAVVAAIIRLDSLLQLAARANVLEISVADADGVLLAHHDPYKVSRREERTIQSRISGGNQFTRGETFLFERDGDEMMGGVFRVGVANVTASAIIPKSTAYLASRQLLSNLWIVALALLGTAALLSLMFSRGLTRHLEALSNATKEIAKGRFNIKIGTRTRDEIGALAGSFNQMAVELRDREEALEGAQRQLVQSAKLAAFGQLGAGIAHEVKNPLAGIRGCAQLSLRKADEGSPIHRNLKLIEKETKRCEAIIQNLLKFARQEKAILESIPLNSVVDDAVAIVHHHLELKGVSLEQELADNLPNVRGNANQLQQVLINLMMNAQQAMESQESGLVQVSTRLYNDESVEVRITDNGPGIPREIQDKIFDPFFTTKPSGKGTGLGLSVSFGIIEEHGGDITLESTPGLGTTFVIHLPVATMAATLTAGTAHEPVLTA